MSEPTVPIEKTPNELLAEEIVAKLEAKTFVPVEKRSEIVGKLAKGTATQQDWKLWLELLVMKQEAAK